MEIWLFFNRSPKNQLRLSEGGCSYDFIYQQFYLLFFVHPPLHAGLYIYVQIHIYMSHLFSLSPSINSIVHIDAWWWDIQELLIPIGVDRQWCRELWEQKAPGRKNGAKHQYLASQYKLCRHFGDLLALKSMHGRLWYSTKVIHKMKHHRSFYLACLALAHGRTR